jgi:hypothetical protein
MKARAARQRDIDDLRLLADIIGVDSADAALRICGDFYPDEPVSARSAAVLHELSIDLLPRRAVCRSGQLADSEQGRTDTERESDAC